MTLMHDKPSFNLKTAEEPIDHDYSGFNDAYSAELTQEEKDFIKRKANETLDGEKSMTHEAKVARHEHMLRMRKLIATMDQEKLSAIKNDLTSMLNGIYTSETEILIKAYSKLRSIVVELGGDQMMDGLALLNMFEKFYCSPVRQTLATRHLEKKSEFARSLNKTLSAVDKDEDLIPSNQ